MPDEAIEDWQGDELVVVPLAWRDEGLLRQIQAITQGRIGANLQTMYSTLVQQPLSPDLLDIAREFERRRTAS